MLYLDGVYAEDNQNRLKQTLNNVLINSKRTLK
jgi:hypothetical protein